LVSSESELPLQPTLFKILSFKKAAKLERFSLAGIAPVSMLYFLQK
jgi:hypothetical protein